MFPYKCLLCNEPILVRSNDSIMSLFQYNLKLVFSEIRVRRWVESVSRQKNRPLICWPIWSTNQRPVFFSGKPLEPMSWHRPEKKLTLVIKHDNIYLPKISIIAANTVYVIHVSSTVNNIIPQGSTELALFTLDTSHNIACTILYIPSWGQGGIE